MIGLKDLVWFARIPRVAWVTKPVSWKYDFSSSSACEVMTLPWIQNKTEFKSLMCKGLDLLQSYCNIHHPLKDLKFWFQIASNTTPPSQNTQSLLVFDTLEFHRPHLCRLQITSQLVYQPYRSLLWVFRHLSSPRQVIDPFA